MSVREPLGSSDHATVHFEINVRHLIPTYVTRFNFKAADFLRIQSYLANVDWYTSFMTAGTVDAMYEMFIAILQHTIELFVPLDMVPLTGSKLPD